MRSALNNNGKSIHPLERGVRNFWNWFNDSEVVDEKGNPLVVFHGSIIRPDNEKIQNMGDIEQFDRLFSTKFRSHSIDTIGSWFSSTPGDDGACLYAGYHVGSVIYPVYLSIKKPEVTTFQLMQRRARLLVNGKDDGRTIAQAEVDAYRHWLKSMGKDGVKIEGSGNEGSTEFDNQVAWIALEPEQIKSSIGNSGSFNPKSAHITEFNQLASELSLDENKGINDRCIDINELEGLSKLVIDWWDSYNPFEDEGLYASNITSIYLVGSRARGTARLNSDFDVAVIFDRELLNIDSDEMSALGSSLKFSESLHSRFGSAMPIWNNVDVDIQIFFNTDKELISYSKIKLPVFHENILLHSYG